MRICPVSNRAHPPEIRIASPVDRTAIANMLARAFADDPAMSYIFPDPETCATRLPRLFGLLFDADSSDGLRLIADDVAGATLWRAPGHGKTDIWEMIRHAPGMVYALGGAVGRALRVSSAIDAHHPSSPYWYLHIAGCYPMQQRRGIGGALIRAGLARVAGDQRACYLETALETNIGFYQGLGFEVLETWEVADGGPRFWSMLRETT